MVGKCYHGLPSSVLRQRAGARWRLRCQALPIRHLGSTRVLSTQVLALHAAPVALASPWVQGVAQHGHHLGQSFVLCPEFDQHWAPPPVANSPPSRRIEAAVSNHFPSRHQPRHSVPAGAEDDCPMARSPRDPSVAVPTPPSHESHHAAALGRPRRAYCRGATLELATAGAGRQRAFHAAR